MRKNEIIETLSIIDTSGVPVCDLTADQLRAELLRSDESAVTSYGRELLEALVTIQRHEHLGFTVTHPGVERPNGRRSPEPRPDRRSLQVGKKNLADLFRAGKRGSHSARNLSDAEAAAEVLEHLLLLISRLRRGKSYTAINQALKNSIMGWEVRRWSDNDSCQFVSEAFLALPETERFGSNNKVREHVVPKTIVVEKLLELGDNPTTEQVMGVLQDWVIVCLITKDEDERFLRGSLTRAMPADWDGLDRFARYRNTSIVVVPNPRHVHRDRCTAPPP